MSDFKIGDRIVTVNYFEGLEPDMTGRIVDMSGSGSLTISFDEPKSCLHNCGGLTPT